MARMTTHYAAIAGTRVIGTRSSASRHADGAGKYAPYTHAVCFKNADGTLQAVSYHGSASHAARAVQTQQSHELYWRQQRGDVLTFETFVAPVVITPKRLTNGQEL